MLPKISSSSASTEPNVSMSGATSGEPLGGAAASTTVTRAPARPAAFASSAALPVDVAPVNTTAGISVAAVVAAGLVVASDPGLLSGVCAFAAAATVAVALGLRRVVPDAGPALGVAVLVLGAGFLAPVARAGTGVALVLLAFTVQLAAPLVLPSRLAFMVVIATAGAAAVGAGLRAPAEAWVVGVALLTLGAALVHVLAGALRQHDIIRMRSISQDDSHSAPGLTRWTRIELDRVKGELDRVVDQLRQETSSRQQAEAQILAALETKEVFLATMSHELRTPLSQIIGYSELLMEESEGADPTQLTGDIGRIHQAGMNLFDIIDNVLDLSRIEAGKASVRPEVVSLYSFIDLLARNFAAQAQRRGNTLRLRCPEDIGTLVTDGGKLHAILKNLVGNACKFTENGTIRIAVELDLQAAPAYVFIVSDTGIGLDATDIDRLFQPFQQADNSRTRRHDGPGLGLAISRHYAAMLGGELTVESELGVGSTFTLRLPRDWPDARANGLIVLSIGA